MFKDYKAIIKEAVFSEYLNKIGNEFFFSIENKVVFKQNQ